MHNHSCTAHTCTHSHTHKPGEYFEQKPPVFTPLLSNTFAASASHNTRNVAHAVEPHIVHTDSHRHVAGEKTREPSSHPQITLRLATSKIYTLGYINFSDPNLSSTSVLAAPAPQQNTGRKFSDDHCTKLDELSVRIGHAASHQTTVPHTPTHTHFPPLLPTRLHSARD